MQSTMDIIFFAEEPTNTARFPFDFLLVACMGGPRRHPGKVLIGIGVL